jgi:hypothetical protein
MKMVSACNGAPQNMGSRRRWRSRDVMHKDALLLLLLLPLLFLTFICTLISASCLMSHVIRLMVPL